LRVVVGCHGHFERRIVLGIFQRVDRGFCSEPVTKGILARFSLALFGDRSGAESSLRRSAAICRKDVIPPPGEGLALFRH
jgi:hypothetical protein